jgi:enamine deaminase RidA (YjgF/YER057c/UK114 family)
MFRYSGTAGTARAALGSFMDVYARLDQLGIRLPDSPPRPVANYVTHAAAGRLLFISGQGPLGADGRKHTGKVGADVSTEAAKDHARITGLNLIAVMQAATGDLNRVSRIVRLLGMVNAVPDYTEHSRVIDGCSDLFADVFGQAGRHARSSVGLGALPEGITVEIEAVVEIAA